MSTNTLSGTFNNLSEEELRNVAGGVNENECTVTFDANTWGSFNAASVTAAKGSVVSVSGIAQRPTSVTLTVGANTVIFSNTGRCANPIFIFYRGDTNLSSISSDSNTFTVNEDVKIVVFSGGEA